VRSNPRPGTAAKPGSAPPARARRAAGRARARLIQGLLAPVLSFVRRTQEHRRSQFAALGCPPRHVVFLGDSISEGGLWDEWFPGHPVLNRGIAGETSEQVLSRLETAINNPRAVFLLIGTNDLTGSVPEEEIVRNVRAILSEIERRAPGCPVFVQSVMPRTAKYLPRIASLNHRLEQLCAEAPPSSRYLDLWPALATPEGTLRPDFSLDRLHLNGEGYRAWVGLIRPFLLDAVQGQGSSS
jgi:lysophospholipase L1-like esterase